jgi:hypothetical protein
VLNHYNRVILKIQGGGKLPRTGRPISDNPKNLSLHVRLDNESAEILKAYCDQEKVEKAEATRRGIKKLDGDIKK